jgi:hypothetical protein
MRPITRVVTTHSYYRRYIYIYIGMTLLVHLTNYGEFRRLIMGTNLRSELNKVYYRGHSYTREQLSTLRLDFPLYAVVLSDKIVLMGTPIESRVTVSVDDYLDLFA